MPRDRNVHSESTSLIAFSANRNPSLWLSLDKTGASGTYSQNCIDKNVEHAKILNRELH